MRLAVGRKRIAQGRFIMSEEDLELLITLDDPEGEPEEDTFHLPAENTDPC